MARKASRRSGRKAAPKGGSKKDRAAVAEIEVVEEEKGLGVNDGIAIGTTILFLVAILLTDYTLGTEYGTGLFFK
ncbi:MAG: hypothetical protein CMJ84_00940 [Planctomycetes bacterium]|jgi:hypothetical protein|nr:hypothetical protein [Planctomycetota bacterium]MDP6408558.1 hypothetical protein [Planctomycetota bacterium]